MYSKTCLVSVFLSLIFLCVGCKTYQVGMPVIEQRPLGKDIPTYSPPPNPSNTNIISKQVEEPSDEISLSQALSLALMNNPELAASSWEVRSGEARSLQANLFPNPELEIGVEDFGGSREVENPGGTADDLRGFEGSETTVALSQLIELGGKRSKRKRVADLERDLLGWNFEKKRLDTITEVTFAFIDLLALQERLSLIEDLVQLSQEVFNAVSERVKAGKVSPVEQTRAQVTLSTIQIELENVKRDLQAGRKRLAAMWGSNTPTFQKVAGKLKTTTIHPPYDDLMNSITQNPDIARWIVELELREAVLHREKADRIPDLTISGGIKYLNESNDETYVMGISLPIPLINRNQGRILEASYDFQRAMEQRTAAEVNTITSLDEKYQTLLAVINAVESLRNTILPNAQDAFSAANEGYLEGKFGYLDVLDAQRSLFDAKKTYINSLIAYHKTITAIERLIGKKLIALE